MSSLVLYDFFICIVWWFVTHEENNFYLFFYNSRFHIGMYIVICEVTFAKDLSIRKFPNCIQNIFCAQPYLLFLI